MTTRPRPRGKPNGEQLDSTQRTLAVLEVLARQPRGVTPKEVSRALGLHLSTVYRLLNTLVGAGYVVRSPESGLFRIARRVAYLHRGYIAALDPVPGALPFIHALQQTTGETSMLVQLEGDDVVATAIVAGSRPEAFPSGYVGIAAPAHAVAAGRVLLAWLPETQLDAFLARCAATTDGPFPLTDPDGFRAMLEEIRNTGYALDHGEGHPEACCVAAPVGEVAGGVHAAVSIMVTCTRLRHDESALIAAVLATARAITSLQATTPATVAHTEAGQPESATRAEIAASIATLAEIMSRVG